MSTTAIKQAALHAFVRSGYDGTALSDIAQRVGLKTPSLYAHFQSKQELFLFTFEDVLREHTQAIQQVLEQCQQQCDTTEAILCRLLLEYCGGLQLGGERAAFLKRALLFPPRFLASGLKERFLLMEQQLSEPLTAVFEAALSAGQVRGWSVKELLTSYFYLMDGCFVQSYLYRRDAFDERLAAAWRIYWRGISR
ncbi:TetR/AcrR family transcriptional regulator [Paenibacillus cremeus]|uniref:TetR/AcrR family transcriptional regulator n=1 Tax=Paenibacillus cremeus TaxID=2163881 RepID=A0A559KIS1_9BACL|nr:TetR/AcrR family transcriptional regulator [Paenibacillus cremeus]TVY11999.1 TetR/AcrR family transcriptional regulator [Paenibacillus cremeus]